MSLSIAAKQNCLYVVFVVLTSLGTIFLYRSTQQEWIIYQEANVKYYSKDYQEAINLYKKSLELGVPFSKIAVKLAHSYVVIGNFNEAIILYKNYLLGDPKNKNIRLELARVLSYNGNFVESEIEYQKTLEDNHENHQIK